MTLCVGKNLQVDSSRRSWGFSFLFSFSSSLTSSSHFCREPPRRNVGSFRRPIGNSGSLWDGRKGRRNTYCLNPEGREGGLPPLDFVGCVNISNGLVPKWRGCENSLDNSVRKRKREKCDSEQLIGKVVWHTHRDRTLPDQIEGKRNERIDK